METANADHKKMLVPKLRFKEFNGEWINLKGSDIFSSSRKKGDERLPMYSVTLDRGMIPRESLDRRMASDAEAGDNLFVAKNDISYNMMRMWQGAYGLAPTDCMVSPAYIVLHPKDRMSPNFFINSFSRSRNLYLFTAYSYGLTSDRLRLYFKDFAQIKFAVPNFIEQQKIASFLSAIDEKIQQLTRKKELLEQYKKGVIQELFPSTGSGQCSGRLSFKDENGKEYPEWEEKLYGEIYSFYSTNSFSRDNLNYENGNVKNIHYGDVHTKFSSLFDITKEIVPYLNEEIDISKIKNENYCQEGDLIIADASEDYADIGKSIELVNLNNEKVISGLHTFLARPNKLKIYKGFSGHLVKAPYIRKQVMTIAQGTKVLSLSTGRLGNIKLKIPCLEEQEKIAIYLTCIDTEIETVSAQITQSQLFKKGLLQQMFV